VQGLLLINDKIPSNLIEFVGEITLDGLLHGEWIEAERKNRNKKVMLTALMEERKWSTFTKYHPYKLSLRMGFD